MKKLLLILFTLSFLVSRGQILGARTGISVNAKKVAFFGNSITLGVGASDNFHRWTNLYSTIVGCEQINYGISGQIMENGGCTTVFDSSTIPNYDGTYGALFISLGVNDILVNKTTMTPAGFYAKYIRVIDYAINSRGWPEKRIVLLTPSYLSTAGYASIVGICSISTPADDTRAQAYEDKVIAVAKIKRTCLANIRQAMLAYGTPNDLLSDGVHPNDLGHAFIANYLSNMTLIQQ